MSIHRSLKASSTMKRHRSVLSRLERVRILEARGSLVLEESSVLGLPKVKHLKIRVKKEKAAAPAAATEAAAAAEAAPGKAAPTTAAPAKGASKGQAGQKVASSPKPEGAPATKKKE